MKLNKKIMEYLTNGNDTITLKEFTEIALKEEQLKMYLNPIVHLTLSKQDEYVYIKGKCIYPISINEEKHISIHIGNLKEFPLGVDDRDAIEICKMKVKKRILELTKF
jgi:hypothetical protein